MILASLLFHIDIVLGLLEEGWFSRQCSAHPIVSLAEGSILKEEMVGHQGSYRRSICQRAGHVELDLQLAVLVAPGLVDTCAMDGADILHATGPDHVLLVLALAPRLPVLGAGQPVVVPEGEPLVVETTRGVDDCEWVDEVGEAMAPLNSTPAANVAGQRGFFALELPFSEELAVLVHGEKRGRQRVGASMIQLVKPSLLVCVETCGKQWNFPATE